MDKRIYIAFILVLMALLGLQRCSHDNNLKESLESVTDYFDQEKKALMNSDSLKAIEIVKLKQNVIDEESANNILNSYYKDFKKIDSHTKSELLTVITGLKIELKRKKRDTIIIAPDLTYVDITDRFEYKDDWLFIGGSVTNTLNIDSLSIINKFDITIGEKKVKGLFKRPELVVELKSYNPYTSVPYINNIIVNKKKNKFTSKGAVFIYGLIGGIVLHKIL